MNTEKLCRKCGSPLPEDAPQGICPKCLMELGLESELRTEAGAGRPIGSGLQPAPALGELAAHFPHLEILEFLGQGGMGIVYKARQPKLDRLVALKLLPLEMAKDPAFTERFHREAKALASLNHPGIVAIFDFGQAGPYFYFLMEYVDGLNLRQIVQSRQLLPDEALGLVPKICDALEYAHDEGVVHRDIKSANILIDKKGRVKIADFGLAKLLGKAPVGQTLTATAQVMGTPHYMAPEQMEGAGAVDHRADIYSLGVVFYEMLTGELPVGRFELPSRKVRVDVRLDEVVLRALEREPERRYQRASEVKTDVESIRSEQITLPAGRKQTQDARVEGAGSDVKKTIRAPAIGLLVSGTLNWAGSIIAVLALFFLATSGDEPRVAVEPPGFLAPAAAMILLGSAIVILGGLKMMRLENYGLAISSSALAMVVSPGNLVGLPMGIWALVVLLRPEVKEAFRQENAIREREKEAAHKVRQKSGRVAPQLVLRLVETLRAKAAPFQIKMLKVLLVIVALVGILGFISSQGFWEGGRFVWQVGQPRPWLEAQSEPGMRQVLVVKASWAWPLLVLGISAFYLFGLIRREEGDPHTLRQGTWIVLAVILAGLAFAAIGIIGAFRTADAAIGEKKISKADRNVPGLKVYHCDFNAPVKRRLHHA